MNTNTFFKFKHFKCYRYDNSVAIVIRDLPDAQVQTGGVIEAPLNWSVQDFHLDEEKLILVLLHDNVENAKLEIRDLNTSNILRTIQIPFNMLIFHVSGGLVTVGYDTYAK